MPSNVMKISVIRQYVYMCKCISERFLSLFQPYVEVYATVNFDTLLR